MKAKRRHELKENDLQHMVEVTRKYLDENGKTIGFAVIIIAIVVSAIAFTVRSRAAAIEDTWRRRNSLSFADPKTGKESLRTLAAMTRESSDEDFVFRGLVDRGSQALRLAREVPAPPDPELNIMAREAFEELLRRFGNKRLAVGIAHCGLATVEENEFVLDRDMAHKNRAEEHLTAVIENPQLSGMPFQRLALDRRTALNKVFAEVEFKYEVPEDEAAEETAAMPADPADPTEMDLSKVPTFRATAAPPEPTPEAGTPRQEETTEPPVPPDGSSGDDSPQTDSADPRQN